nr:CPPV027 ankyrin repeat protein [Cooks petrelpox virus]
MRIVLITIPIIIVVKFIIDNLFNNLIIRFSEHRTIDLSKIHCKIIPMRPIVSYLFFQYFV